MKQRRLKETPVSHDRSESRLNSAPVDNSLSLSLSLSNSLLKNSSNSILRCPCRVSFNLRKNKSPFLRRSSTFLKFIPVCSVLLLVLLSLTVFPLAHEPNYTEAADTPTPTLTVSTTSPDVSLTPTVAGKFAEAKGTITVNTNNYTGYTLTIKSNTTNTGKLVNQEDNTKYLSSIPAGPGISQSSFRDDATYNNMWGYRPGMLNSTANSNYLSAPSTAGDLLDNHRSSGTTNYDIYLGVRANLNLPAGEYNNTFIITATANVAHYTITYNKNTTDTVSGMPSTQDADGTAVAIGAAPERSGYNFLDWCTVAVADGAACSGITYEPGSTFTADPTKSNNITLYARWEIASLCGTTPTMQNIANLKSGLSEEVQTQLCDERDGKTYYVAKLKDGNIWMTQNLDLDIPADGLSSTDTDITTNWNSSSTYQPVATLTNASSYTSSTNTAVQSWDAGNYYYNGTSSTHCGRGKTTYSGCTGFSTSGDAHYHVGNMYSWNAATAGTGGTITSGQASGSICPKGWRLPMSSGSPSFADLQSKASLGSTVSKWIGSPYYFVRGGILWYDSDKLTSAGSYGHYWSSTPDSDSSNACYLYFRSSSDVYPASNNKRAVGMSVRCVAR